MSIQDLLQFGPLIGGLVLLLICLINIVRSPGISNANAVVLGLGALICSVPALGNFAFETPLIKVSGQRIEDQVLVQGAEFKRYLTDIKVALEVIGKQAGGSAATTVTKTVSVTKPPAKLVLLFYVPEQEDLAMKLEGVLLRGGYAANVKKTNFSELKSDRREREGTVRIVFTSKAESDAQALSSELKGHLPDITRLVESKNDNLTASDLQVQIF
jgi:hypothetical protein